MVRQRGGLGLRAPQVRPTRPYLHGSERSPDTLRRCIRGLRLGLLMADVKPSAAAEMTLLPKERPLVAEMKAWAEENLTRLPPDQRALVMGVEPQGDRNRL